MENNGCHLKVFSSSLTDYCSDKLCGPCLSSLRKHKVKNLKDVEFSLHLRKLSFSNTSEYNSNQDPNITPESIAELIKASESWSLHLASASIAASKLLLKLNQLLTLTTIVKHIEDTKCNFGRHFTIAQNFSIWTDVKEIPTNLTHFRTQLVGKVTSNLLETAGWILDPSAEQVLRLVSKAGGRHDAIVVGPVLSKDTRCKADITVHQYHQLRKQDMKTMAEHRGRMSGDLDTMVDVLASACLTVDLIRTCPEQAVKLNLRPEATSAREPSCKGAAFVMYNRARLARLQDEYSRRVECGLYNRTSLADGDLSHLREPEEWALAFNFLLEYPNVLEQAADISRPSPHILCNFLLGVVSLFSLYYRRVKVLQEPKPHLIPVMAARLRFLAAVQQVIDNILTIFNITRLSSM